MVTTRDSIRAACDALAAIDPAFAQAIERAGYPEPRVRERGYGTLLRTIVGQQGSAAAAAPSWRKREEQCGDLEDPANIAKASDEQLRAAGLSRQKASYARSLAEEVTSRRLDLANLPEDDEEAIARLVQVKGIGRWTAEIYLLIAEGRRDIWPAGDLAVQIETGLLLGLDERPSEKALRALSEAWRPHRGALAVFAWHHRRTTSAPV